MIILSQDKEAILNFNNITELQTEEHIKNMDGEKEIMIEAVGNLGNTFILAYYDTEERAKEVLQEIIEAYKDYRTAECDGYTDILQKTAVYEMPEE